MYVQRHATTPLSSHLHPPHAPRRPRGRQRCRFPPPFFSRRRRRRAPPARSIARALSRALCLSSRGPRGAPTDGSRCALRTAARVPGGARGARRRGRSRVRPVTGASIGRVLCLVGGSLGPPPPPVASSCSRRGEASRSCSSSCCDYCRGEGEGAAAECSVRGCGRARRGEDAGRRRRTGEGRPAAAQRRPAPVLRAREALSETYVYRPRKGWYRSSRLRRARASAAGLSL